MKGIIVSTFSHHIEVKLITVLFLMRAGSCPWLTRRSDVSATRQAPTKVDIKTSPSGPWKHLFKLQFNGRNRTATAGTATSNGLVAMTNL
uniref:Uncharacterized protein n=1 Tax=Physcomitrium patens TaxID=3218 RepID=A0A7I4D730_PHYPA